MSDYPQNPVAAVTHANPYPYYADLLSNKPFYFDETLKCWVATSADAAQAVLSSQICRVRPPTEPVPKPLLGSSAATIFQHLVRMNDGDRHQPFKRAVVAALSSIDDAQVKAQAYKWAHLLIDELNPIAHPEHLSDFNFRLPIYVMASLLGIPDDLLHQTALWIAEYVACLSPLATPPQIEQGKVAAGHLLDLFHSILFDENSNPNGLLTILAKQASLVGQNEAEIIAANGIGFLTQTYEATAGLIGASIVTLSDHTDLRRKIINDRNLLPAFVQEVSRFDSPVQNTRRFLAQDGTILGQNMHSNDAVLVILAAANHDPSVNPQPETFDIFRSNRRIFTFGVGAHACAGEHLATAITAAALEQLMASGFEFDLSTVQVHYRPSVNTRIPLFQSKM